MRESGEVARERGAGLWWWPRRRSVFLDGALATISAAECAMQGFAFAERTGLPVQLTAALGALAGTALLVRRQWPVAVILVAIAVIPAHMGNMLAVVGLYTLATTEAPRRIIAGLAGMVGAGSMLVMYLAITQDSPNPSHSTPAWFVLLVAAMFATVSVLPPVLLGMYVRARRRLVESLRERADGLERELGLLAERAEQRAEWARREERTRIAREMHDVVAHRVSLMVVHAGALRAVARQDPEKAERTAGLLADMGRQALTELRTMLGVLRTDAASDEQAPAPHGTGAESADDPSGGAPDPAAGAGTATNALTRAVTDPAGGAPDGGRGGGHDRVPDTGAAPAGAADDGPPRTLVARPAPGGGSAPAPATGAVRADPDPAEATAWPAEADGPYLTGLATLVEQSRQAGMPVELAVEGEARSYPAQVERTAFRVVQEALTNAHKHAAGAAVRVRLAHREGEVAVLVHNDAPERAGPAAGAALPSGGNGLVGMRERVSALGGGFVSGPTEGGGFRVSAVIPGTAARSVAR